MLTPSHARLDLEDNDLSAKGAYRGFDVFFHRISVYTCFVQGEPNRLGLSISRVHFGAKEQTYYSQ